MISAKYILTTYGEEFLYWVILIFIILFTIIFTMALIQCLFGFKTEDSFDELKRLMTKEEIENIKERLERQRQRRNDETYTEEEIKAIKGYPK